MPDESHEFPLDELVAGLIELANEGNPQALHALTSLVGEQGAELPDGELGRIARVEVAGSEGLRRLVAKEMRRRGIWRRFRARQLAGVYGSAAGWLFGIVLLALLLLVVVLGGVVGLKWLLGVMGF